MFLFFPRPTFSISERFAITRIYHTPTRSSDVPCTQVSDNKVVSSILVDDSSVIATFGVQVYLIVCFSELSRFAVYHYFEIAQRQSVEQIQFGRKCSLSDVIMLTTCGLDNTRANSDVCLVSEHFESAL